MVNWHPVTGPFLGLFGRFSYLYIYQYYMYIYIYIDTYIHMYESIIVHKQWSFNNVTREKYGATCSEGPKFLWSISIDWFLKAVVSWSASSETWMCPPTIVQIHLRETYPLSEFETLFKMSTINRARESQLPNHFWILLWHLVPRGCILSDSFTAWDQNHWCRCCWWF